MSRAIPAIRDGALALLGIDRRLDQIRINQGLILRTLTDAKQSHNINDHEFKVFSQWGEDGIIQFLSRSIKIENKTFIEFGIADFLESNCRFLMMADLWHGYVIDGSSTYINRLKNSYYYYNYPLVAVSEFITKENIAGLLDASGFDKEVGILSVDVDGIDYHLLEALAEWRASIVIVEYNSLYGAERAVTVPYRPDFVRSKIHCSCIYYGASLPAFHRLLKGRGYDLVGVNAAGSNAFFVRSDLLTEKVKAVALADTFRRSVFREARDEKGRLTFLSARESVHSISNLPLLDLETGTTTTVAEVCRLQRG